MSMPHLSIRLLAAFFLVGHLAAATADVMEREVSFKNGDVTLAGTLLVPSGLGTHPSLVMMPGSGDETRNDFIDQARAFAAQGLITLVYDKRGVGKSQGSWADESLDDLAGDAAAAMHLLRSIPEVDPKHIGAWGISQSGWVLPRLAKQAPDLAFVICVTGGGTTPREVEEYCYDNELAHAGFSQTDRDAVHVSVEEYMQYLATGEDRESLLQKIRAAKAEKWSSIVDLGRVLPDASGREKWAWVASYDPLSDTASMRMPVLVMLGGRDPFTPTQGAFLGWQRALGSAGDPADLIMEYPYATHGIRINGHDMQAAPIYAPGYLDVQFAWLRSIGMLH